MTAEEELATAYRREDIKSVEARQLLADTIRHINSVLREIDSGAGFCDDRGFDWGYEQERRCGSDAIYARLLEWPILRRLLPHARHLRHQREPVISLEGAAPEDARVALDSLYSTTEFTTRYGKDWEEMILSVQLADGSIVIRERTAADDMGGRPFHTNEERIDYSDFTHEHATWRELVARFPEDDFRRLCGLALRRWRMIAPCDICGATVHRYELHGEGLMLRHWSCWDDERIVPITAATRAVFRNAMPVQDLPAIRAIAPRLTHGYCVECDGALCRVHFKAAPDVGD